MVVFAPHPDDETLGCGGTILKRIAEGYEVFIVVMTDGRHALSKMCGLTDLNPEKMKRIRRSEMLRAMAILGVPSQNVFFWDFEDGLLANCTTAAKVKVLKLLNELNPSEVYYPYEKDYHCDHRAAGVILQDCIPKLNYFPETYRYLIEHKFARFGPLVARILKLFRQDIFSVDITEFLDKKASAIAQFESQIKVVCDEQDHPVVEKVKNHLEKNERFYLTSFRKKSGD